MISYKTQKRKVFPGNFANNHSIQKKFGENSDGMGFENELQKCIRIKHEIWFELNKVKKVCDLRIQRENINIKVKLIALLVIISCK